MGSCCYEHLKLEIPLSWTAAISFLSQNINNVSSFIMSHFKTLIYTTSTKNRDIVLMYVGCGGWK